jgi:hypothetical protein
MDRSRSLSFFLSPPLPPSVFSLLFFREQIWLRITFLIIAPLSPRSSSQGASISYHLAPPCSFVLPPLLPSPPRFEHCFSFGFRRSLVLGLYPLLLYQAETSVNALFCHPSVRLTKLLFLLWYFVLLKVWGEKGERGESC